MTGKTHRVGGVLCALGGFTYLQSKGLLLNNINPALQLLVMYPFAVYGSTFPDLDHNENSSPNKDVFGVVINKVLHLSNAERGPLKIFNAKHRSWQTHSDLFLALVLALGWYVFKIPRDGYTAEKAILMLVGMGFALGLISHMILDLLTPEGLWSLLFIGLGKIFGFLKSVLPRKIRLVPYMRFFYTGGKWESFVRTVLWVLSIILLVRIVYILSPYKIVF